MRHRNALMALLGVQLILVALTWWPGDPTGSQLRPLIGIDAGDVRSLEISAGPEDGAAAGGVELVRRDGQWTVASAGGYVADGDAVEKLVEDLVALRVRRPIATQSSSHAQLKVGGTDYGKRIAIETPDQSYTLIVGAAANDRSHVRFEGEDEVYLVSGLSEWAIRDDPSAYYSDDYLDVELADLSSVTLTNPSGSLDFRREAGAWTLASAPAGAAIDSEAVESMLGKLLDLKIARPIGDTVEPSHGLDGALRVDWTGEAEDQSIGGGYRVGATDGDETYVKSSTTPYVVTVSSASLAPLREARAGDFYEEIGSGSSTGAGTGAEVAEDDEKARGEGGSR